MSAEDSSPATILKEADERLGNGTWREAVQAGMDCLIAGEDNAKWVLFYSGLSANLREKLHVYLMGKSQIGKSYCQTKMGELFEEIFKDITDMSPKALYYEVKSKENPALYSKSIVFLDEFTDRHEDIQNFAKKAMSCGANRFTNKTVIDQKFAEMEIDGTPVIWTNSMQRFRDEDEQVMNRPFPLNVNESLAQSRTVEAFQKIKEKYGDIFKIQERKKKLAHAIIYMILQKGGFTILNPFSDFIELVDHSRRNTRPKFHALLSAITYANRFQRIRGETDSGKHLLATLSDNLEALDIFKANEKYLKVQLAERYWKFFEIFGDEPLSKEEMVDAYRLKHGSDSAITAETAYQYAHDLEEKGLLKSRYREGEKFKEWFIEDSSSTSNLTILELKNIEMNLLAKTIRGYFEAGLVTSMTERELLDNLLDAPIPEASKVDSEQRTLDGIDKEPKEKIRRSDEERLTEINERVSSLITINNARGLGKLTYLSEVDCEIDDLFDKDIDQAEEYFKGACERKWLPFIVGVDESVRRL